MPTYEYRCTGCGHELEAYQPITAKPLKKCPECSTMSLNRLISGGGAVLFKGGGFYETDYRSESYKKAQKAESDAAKPKEPCSTNCACAADSKASADSNGPAKKDASNTNGTAKPASQTTKAKAKPAAKA